MPSNKEKVIAIIPARIGSTRLPRKVLLPIGGKPMIQVIYENAIGAKLVDEVYVATDSEEVKQAVEAFNGKAIITPVEGIHSGSDRVAFAAKKIPHDIAVNIQGDEPFMTGRMIDEAVKPVLGNKDLVVSTLCREITRAEEFDEPGVVKVVHDLDGNGLYFSRARIPFPRNPQGIKYFEHLGIYVFRRDFLQQFVKWEPSNLEKVESLEMLRIIEHGVKLKVPVTREDTSHYLSVDTQEDIDRANEYQAIRAKTGEGKTLTAPATNNKLLDAIQKELPPTTATRLDEATKAIVDAKKHGGKVVVVTGSGPNIHEGITTLIAGLIRQEIVDGVITSSAVIAHELAGSLDKVKRFPGSSLGFALQQPMSLCEPPAGQYFLPRGEVFEITELTEKEIDTISADFPVDKTLLKKANGIEGKVIIKAAGNMAYPMGPRTEALASTLLKICKKKREPLEAIAGPGADPMTMIGAAGARGIPVLVSIPQMVGGGNMGICIGDSISIKDRCERIARLLGSASVIVESALALAQEIHDGPFETYTGHGIWGPVSGTPTYSLRDKHLIRIDLDPALQTVWEKEHAGGDVQRAIDDGKPKTKLFNVPFRMEMSGFARLEKSNPVIGDIGGIWPLLARGVAEGLGKRLEFTSYPQGTPDGQAMREWIVENVSFFDFARLNAKTRR